MNTDSASPRTVITCHANADWDALASLIGASLLYPDAILFFPGSMERRINEAVHGSLGKRFQLQTGKDIDCTNISRLVIVDTRKKSRVRHLLDRFAEHLPPIIVWDHHLAEKNENTESFIQPAESHIRRTGATVTLICEELFRRGIIPDPETATWLGLGLYSDTGLFLHPCTTPEDFAAAAQLRAYGMDPAEIEPLVRTEITDAQIHMLSELLESAEIYHVGGSTVCIASASTDVFIDDIAALSRQILDIKGTDAAFILADMTSKTQVIARSLSKDVDVGSVCRELGGGGHAEAASASIGDIPLPELKDRLIRLLSARSSPQKTAMELMTSPPVGLHDSTTIEESAAIMNRYGLKAAPVFASGTRHCIGLIENRTAALAVAHGLNQQSVSDYMQAEVRCVPPDAPLQKLLEIIIGAGQRLVPVIDRGETLGVVTRTDLVRLFSEDPAELSAAQKIPVRERNISGILTTHLPEKILSLLRSAGSLGDSRGQKVYAVGGFVRDILLNRPASALDDVDLVVEGDGIAFAKAFSIQLGGRVHEHRTFMTARISYSNEDGSEAHIDVATARLEYYPCPAALPTVELSSIKMDLFRRDFTVNAMALRLNANRFGDIADFFGGMSDLRKRNLRVLHSLSYVEDPTRMLRAVRFERRYHFRVGSQGEKLIKNALSLGIMERLAGWRILHELELIFRENNPVSCLDRLHELGILEAVHPELRLTPERRSVLLSLLNVLSWYRRLYLPEIPDETMLWLTALCSGLSTQKASSVLHRLEYSEANIGRMLSLRKSVRETICLIREEIEKDRPRISHFHAILSNLSLEACLYLTARNENEEISKTVSKYLYAWKRTRIDLNGRDLQHMGLPPGPQCGAVLRRLLEAKLDGEAETREEQTALAQKLIREAQKNKQRQNF
ncbi:MAG: CBS domain-containing protein [Desulfovibrionaceae bacterium]|nr:CBS domain-containing protein [Desulfovibrionaceae bacterium]